MKRVTASVTLLLICLYGLMPVEALSITGLSVALDCGSFTYSAFHYVFDRDNTGLGTEAYQIIVTDSDNNVIHLVSNSATLGSYDEPSGGGAYNLGTAVPGAITYQWISQAGNSFEEQV